MAEEVYNQVFAQFIRRSEENSAFVQTRHPFYKEIGIILARQHKGVNVNTGAGAFFNLIQRHFQAALAGGYFEEDLALFDMGGRLTVGNKDDLLVGAAVFLH